MWYAAIRGCGRQSDRGREHHLIAVSELLVLARDPLRLRLHRTPACPVFASREPAVSEVIWVLLEDWCSDRSYSPVRWFRTLADGAAWVAEHPPQEYQDFLLCEVAADGEPVPDYGLERPKPRRFLLVHRSRATREGGGPWRPGMPPPLLSADRQSYELCPWPPGDD